jgi:hypothetical protein
MSASIIGHLIHQTTGAGLSSPKVMLYRPGVLGETAAAAVDEHGAFSFIDLAPGEYSIGIYDDRFVPHHLKLVLGENEQINDLEIQLTPGGFLSGKLLDEQGRPPERCWFSLFRQGERRGKSGYISDSGAHFVASDGTFTSPPLGAARYLLQFAGILQKPEAIDPSEPKHLVMQKRVFDFLYPDANHLAGATAFDVPTGQTISNLQIRIPRPIWHTIRGKVIGELPKVPGGIHVMFSRDIGAVDGGGSSGATIQPDGTFEGLALSGRYSAEISEFSPPEPCGNSRILRRLGTASLTVEDADLSGFEIHVSPATGEHPHTS